MPVLRDMAHARVAALPDAELCDISAVESYFAAARLLKPRQGIYQLGLTVAVDTRDADYLAASDLKRNILDGVVLMAL